MRFGLACRPGLGIAAEPFALVGVYVKPQFRERGIGSALVTRVEEEAKVLAVPTLYLYTPHSGFFLGVSFVCQKSAHKEQFRVFFTRFEESA
jgi:N-acetylglutamate synthase-like GNAT family acetyltransferase